MREETTKLERNYVPEESVDFQGRNYAVRSKIGQGATSVVYVIEDAAQKQLFACKVSDKISILRGESATLKEIRHPLYPGWVDYWETDRCAVLVMEYINGNSLKELLLRRGRMSWQETVRIATELADGIAYLHESRKAYIYRDLKPENVLIGQDGTVHLLDLGAACAGEGYRVGTKGYAPPELFGTGMVQPNSDVYTLGRMMQYMITGQDPCNAKIQDGNAELRFYAKRGLADIVNRCTLFNQEERIQDMRDLIRELGIYRSGGKMVIFRKEAELLLNDIIKRLPFFRQWNSNPIYEKNIWLSCHKDMNF